MFLRGSLQLKLRLAAKARIMRMVKAKSKRRDLEVPEWVKAEWGKGNKNQIADLLCSANFDKDQTYYIYTCLMHGHVFRLQNFLIPIYASCMFINIIYSVIYIYIYIHIFSWLLLRLRIFTMFSTLVFLPPATQIHAGSLFEFPSRRGDEEEGGFCGG